MDKKIVIIISVYFCVIFLFFAVYYIFIRETNNHEINEVFNSQTIAPINKTESNETKVLKRWPAPTISPVMENTTEVKDSEPEVLKSSKRYLSVNPIKIIDVFTNTDGDINIELKYPKIEGLVDCDVQNKINNDIEKIAESFQEKAYMYTKDLKSVSMHYNISANYNNILCVNIYKNVRLIDNNFMMRETLLYELVNGNRLELKDIFNSKADFPGILNKAIDEYFLKNNLEETMLSKPFKGIRVDQSYELTESMLIIHINMNTEIKPSQFMIYRPADIFFEIDDFNGMLDIYNKYSNPEKRIYQSEVIKRKMLPNDIQVIHKEVDIINDKYLSNGFKIVFRGMKNSELEKELNEICSYTGEEEFKKLFPEDFDKVKDISQKPYINRTYGLTAKYGDVISISCSEHFFIPDVAKKDSFWHINYNIITGKKLELKDIFKNNYDWKKSIVNLIKEDATKRNLQLDKAEIDAIILKADFWFNDEMLFINLDTENSGQSKDKIISKPFDYFGEEYFTIRE